MIINGMTEVGISLYLLPSRCYHALGRDMRLRFPVPFFEMNVACVEGINVYELHGWRSWCVGGARVSGVIRTEKFGLSALCVSL